MARKLIVEIVGDPSNLQRSFGRASHSAKGFERDMSHVSRGVLAGSGVFRSLGRSLAFASGGFLAFASVTEVLRKSIEAATLEAASQRQLVAQFKASGLALGRYSKAIEETTLHTSELSGFTRTDLTDAFTTAFRGSQNVAVGLRIEALAADVARGRHIDLTKASIALTKAYGGQSTALKRLGILVPANLKGMAALEFVQRRFAGQAQAGTTAQQRFSAALFNTEVSIGQALLPTLTNYLNRASKWLNNTENQKKIQHDVSTAVKITSGLLGIGVHAVEGYTLAWGKFEKLMHRLGGTGLDQVALKLKLLGGALQGPVGTPIRAGGTPPGLTGPAGKPPSAPRTGLHSQFLQSQLALAKAQVSAAGSDDRRILVQQARLIRAAIAQTTNLRKRTALYSRLASIEEQVRAIDRTAADKRQQAQQKLLDARQKLLDARKKALEADKAQAQKELGLLRDRERTLKGQIKAITGRLKDQVDVARQGIGDLFAGPVKPPVDEVRRRTLGLSVPAGPTAGSITADLRAQVRQFNAFQRDINRLIRRGASPELIKEIRAQGLAGAPQAHALATATTPALKAFFTAFAKREKLALTTARTVMRSQLVTLHADQVKLADIKERERPIIVKIDLEGKQIAQVVAKHQNRRDKNNAPGRRGHNAGRG